MATRDIQRLIEGVRGGRPPTVLPDGTVDIGDEPPPNPLDAGRDVPAAPAPPRQRVKPATFGEPAEACFSEALIERDGTVIRRLPERMHQPTEDRVSESALRRMSELAAQYPGVETGGIGLGMDSFSITEIIGSGPTAERSSDSFGLDPAFLNPALDAAQARGCRWTSVWHVHPEGCLEPSHTDWIAARKLLNDPDTGLEGRLLLPISTRTPTGVSTRFFVAEGSDARIRQVSPAIQSDPRRPAVPADRSSNLEAMLLACRERRLRCESDELERAGFQTAQRDSATGARVVRAVRGNVALWLVLPQEFPLSPPETFVEEGATLRAVPPRDLPSLLGWSSSCSLLELAEQAQRSVLIDREAEATLMRPNAIQRVCRAWSSLIGGN